MQDLTIGTLLAVFEEIFGPVLFWALVIAAIIVSVLYVYVLLRDRQVSLRKFLMAQLSMPVGAILAIVFVQWATSSRLAHIGGPIDVIVLLGIAAVGAIGLAILVYTLQSLVWPPKRDLP